MKKLQRAISTLGFFYLTLFLFGCCGSKTEESTYSITQNPPFSIEDAYSQELVAGVKGGGSGTNIYLKIENLEPGTLINEVYFRSKTIKAKNTTKNLFVGYFKNDKNRDVIMDSNPTKEAENIPPKPFPFKLAENEAVLSYIFKGRDYYYKLLDITEKETLAYPQSNIIIKN